RDAHAVGHRLHGLHAPGPDALRHYTGPRIEADGLGEVSGQLQALGLKRVGDDGHTPQTEAGDAEGSHDGGDHQAADVRAAVVGIVHGVFQYPCGAGWLWSSVSTLMPATSIDW